MTRIRTAWVRWNEGRQLDVYLRQRAWHWCVKGNYALATDYTIHLLNRHARDPLALVLGGIAARGTQQPEYADKCAHAAQRLCFVKDVDDVTELIPVEGGGPSKEEVRALREAFALEQAETAKATAASSSSSSSVLKTPERISGAAAAADDMARDERIDVWESEPLEATQQTARRSCLRVNRDALAELLLPKQSTYGRGLYATRRILSRTPILLDQPFLVQRMDRTHCAHCLAVLEPTPRSPHVSHNRDDDTDGMNGSIRSSRRDGGEDDAAASLGVCCPHCKDEAYCSVSCQEAAWAQYHAVCCAATNPLFANWHSAMEEAMLTSGGSATAHDDAGSAARAALSCMAVGKLCAMATIQQVHPLALTGIRSLRGTAEYEPTTALSEIGALAVALAAALRQTHLYMEEVLSLFALLQSNEFLLTGGTALYPVLSLLNHSCEPNCAVIGANVERQLIALRDIRDGEQLFVDYNANLTTKLNYEQRKALCAQRHFVCFCPKCVRRV